MKNTILLFAAICCFASSSRAAVYTISVGEHEFTPAKGLTVRVGDTVKWVWEGGAHNIMSDKIPAGAQGFGGKVNGRAPSMVYVASVPGNYDYQCKYYAVQGMVGSFTVVGANASIGLIGPVEPSGEGVVRAHRGVSAFSTFPAPVSTSLHMQFHNASQPVVVTITDADGKEVKRVDYPAVGETELDMKDMPNGTYVLHAEQGDRIYKQDIIVRH